MVTPVKQVEQQRIDGGGTPRTQSLKPSPYLRVSFLVRVQDRPKEPAEAAEAGNLCLDVSLGPQAVQPRLLPGVGVGLLDTGVSLHEVQPEEQLQFTTAELVLQRKPPGLVDSITSAGEPHEQVVAQQISLRELQARIVQRLEDPVSIVAVLGRDGHQRQPRDDRVLNVFDVQRIVRVIGGNELSREEPVRRTNRIAAAGLRSRIQARQIGRSVSLSRQELQPMLLRFPLVDQVLLVETIAVLRILCGGAMVANGAEKDLATQRRSHRAGRR